MKFTLMIIGMCILSLYANGNITIETIIFGLLCVVITVCLMAVGVFRVSEENNSDKLKNE